MKYFSSLAYTLFVISFSSLSCASEDSLPIDSNDPEILKLRYPEGSIFGLEGPTKIIDVTNPKTGKTWMDRNLGASRVATSSTDAESYGDLYQWGRGTDGHQKRTSVTTTTLSSSNTPGNANFIITNSSPFDWRSPQNGNLWQGVTGTNNPCPNGYRLPTEAEWLAEVATWGNNADYAFISPLKLPKAGLRGYLGGFDNIDVTGSYWSSTVIGTLSRSLYVGGGNVSSMTTEVRTFGASVRCIKD